MEIYSLAAFAGLIYLCVSFYWPRVLSLLALLIIWGLFVTIGPLFLAARALSDGHLIKAFMTLAVSALPAFFFCLAVQSAREWVDRQLRLHGTIMRPWNARD